MNPTEFEKKINEFTEYLVDTVLIDRRLSVESSELDSIDILAQVCQKIKTMVKTNDEFMRFRETRLNAKGKS